MAPIKQLPAARAGHLVLNLGVIGRLEPLLLPVIRTPVFLEDLLFNLCKG